MASPEEIEELRRMIDEPGQDPYDDSMLSDRIDASPDLASLAATIWREKAARYSGLVDVREGNSDRKLSQLHTQAMKMASSYDGVSSGEAVAGGRTSRTRKIDRQ